MLLILQAPDGRSFLAIILAQLNPIYMDEDELWPQWSQIQLKMFQKPKEQDKINE